LVYGRIAGFFMGLSRVKFHQRWRRKRSGLVDSELPEECANVAVLMDVDRVMLPIVINVYAEIACHTPYIMSLEPSLHMIRDLDIQALVSNA
jgi:hypothetical protein